MGPDAPVLIRFDAKTCGCLVGLVLLLAAGTAFKIHGSSIGFWSGMPPNSGSDTGVLFGTPRAIRSDEWAVTTLAMLSQARSRPPFPLANTSLGPEHVPLIFNLPARHWSMLVRPQFWGFFALDVERGFAFYWCMKGFILLSGFFLLLMLLTRNDFWIALLGSAWVFFSGFMQWWYSTPAMLPETVGCVAWLLVAAHYLVLSASRWVIAGSALAISASALDAALSLYPPFQIPLLHLGIAILVGSLGPRLLLRRQTLDFSFRAGCAAAAVSVTAIVIALYYRDAKPTIDLMLGTVYPGSRSSLGGDVSLTQIFGGFYGFIMSESSFPNAWFNVCEASNFVLLFPVPLAVLIWRVLRRQSTTALEWSLGAYVLIVVAWMAIGAPRFLAVASALSLSQGTRSLVGLGLGSILLCCVFLSKQRIDLPASARNRILIAGALLAPLVLLALDFSRLASNSTTPLWIGLATLVAGIAAYLLLARKRALFAVLVLVPSVWAHALVNPVAIGLRPILEAKIFRQVSEIVDREPDARWTVYGDYFGANLFKATGARVFNGTKVVPPLDDLRLLDPDSRAASIYNRYANIGMIAEVGPHIRVALLLADNYTIEIDPKNDVWRLLGIRYVALPFESKDREFLERASLVLAEPEAGFWIYRYTWLPG